MTEYDSLIEIAVEMMKNMKPHTLPAITKEVFDKKGINVESNPEAVAQFEIDFMLCGSFICCGEDKKGNKLWDLKERQPHELLDKESLLIGDPYEDDEDVKANELTSDFGIEENTVNEFGQEESTEDEDEEVDEKDDIEEALELNNDIYDEDQELDEDSYDDKDE